MILPFLKRNSLMSFLPSQHLQPHCCLCQEGCKEQVDGEEGGHALIPQISFLSPYSHFQLLLVAPSPVSSFLASSSCPAAASGKSQPLSGETVAGGNCSPSSITGFASRAGSLPILALLWLLCCSFTVKRPVASCPPARELQSQSRALSGYSLRLQKLLIIFFTGAQIQLEDGVSHRFVVKTASAREGRCEIEVTNTLRQRRELQLRGSSVKKMTVPHQPTTPRFKWIQ